LPNNDRGVHIKIHLREGFMKYAVEMDSGAMIYIPSSIKIGSGIQKLAGRIHRQHGYRISLLFFSKQKSMLRITGVLDFVHRPVF
jgi:hypothetical protein